MQNYCMKGTLAISAVVKFDKNYEKLDDTVNPFSRATLIIMSSLLRPIVAGQKYKLKASKDFLTSSSSFLFFVGGIINRVHLIKLRWELRFLKCRSQLTKQHGPRNKHGSRQTHVFSNF